MPCPTCARLLPARGPVPRCVETMVGPATLERPYFYCQGCHAGTYPLDAVLGVRAGRMQPDVQQAAVDLATEFPYETASRLFGRLSGIPVSSERMHTPSLTTWSKIPVWWRWRRRVRRLRGA